MSLEKEMDCNASLDGTELVLFECEFWGGKNFVLVWGYWLWNLKS